MEREKISNQDTFREYLLLPPLDRLFRHRVVFPLYSGPARSAQKGIVSFRQRYNVLNQPLIFSRLTRHALPLRNSLWPTKQPKYVHFPIFSSKRTRHSRVCCKPIAWRAHPVWAVFQKAAWPST